MPNRTTVLIFTILFIVGIASVLLYFKYFPNSVYNPFSTPASKNFSDSTIVFAAVKGANTSTALDVYSLSPNAQPLDLTPSNDPAGFSGSINPTLSADLKKIAIATFKTGEGVIIATMNVDGTGKKQVSHLKGPKLMPSWSPDGTMILYPLNTLSGGIVKIDLATGAETVQTTSYKNTETPFWLPDGTGFGFVAVDVTNGVVTGNHLITSHNGATKEIKATVDGAVVNDYANPSFSPDGQKVLFTKSSDSQIYIMNVDGSNVKRLTDSTSGAFFSCPSWSPDGSYILTAEGKKATNLEYISKVVVSSGQLTHWSVTGYSKLNCPRVTRY